MTKIELQALRAFAEELRGAQEPQRQYLLGVAKGLELAAARRQAEDKETQERAGA